MPFPTTSAANQETPILFSRSPSRTTTVSASDRVVWLVQTSSRCYLYLSATACHRQTETHILPAFPNRGRACSFGLVVSQSFSQTHRQSSEVYSTERSYLHGDGRRVVNPDTYGLSPCLGRWIQQMRTSTKLP